MTGILFAILAISIAQSAAGDDNYYHINNVKYRFSLGTQTVPDIKLKLLPQLSNCTAKQAWVLASHGVRYPDVEFRRQLPKLNSLHHEIKKKTEQSGRLCEENFESLRNWTAESSIYQTTTNDLTPRGRRDIRYLAYNLRFQFPNIMWVLSPYIKSDDYKFRYERSTWSSMKSFMKGLFGYENAIITMPPRNDTLLSAYKNCPAWNSSIEKDHVYTEAKKFMDGPEYQTIVSNVRRRLSFNDTIDNDSIKLMYKVCGYETALEPKSVSPWCTVFNKEDFEVLEYLEDLYYYYYSGPGRKINAKLGCTLVKDLFHRFEKLKGNYFKNIPKGVFYFTDTITFQNFIAALGIANDSTPLRADNFQSMKNRHFRTSIIGSHTSNLITVFHRCNDPVSPNKKTFYLNQNSVQIDGCSEEFCNWDYLWDRFGKTADECSLDFCNGATSTAV